jgi:negative regulator of flagellin synthesis FlgM
MKITPPSENPVVVSSNAASLAPKSGSTAGVQTKPAAPKSAPAAGVAVSVSSLARSMDVDGADQLPDVDMAKVNAVKQAISDGSYKVNPGVIADKLLSNAQEMLQRSGV